MMESGKADGDKPHHFLCIVAAVAESQKEAAGFMEQLDAPVPDDGTVSKKPAKKAQEQVASRESQNRRQQHGGDHFDHDRVPLYVRKSVGTDAAAYHRADHGMRSAGGKLQDPGENVPEQAAGKGGGDKGVAKGPGTGENGSDIDNIF